MPRRKPETLALAVSLAGTLIVLLVFMADLVWPAIAIWNRANGGCSISAS
jgi:hypothetical protein